MWKDDSVISSRRELACPNTPQTHSRRAHRLNKEKPALTLWDNGERFGLRFLHRLRISYYALFSSLRRFHSHPLPPSHHPLRHRPPCRPQIPAPAAANSSSNQSYIHCPQRFNQISVRNPLPRQRTLCLFPTFRLPTIRSACFQHLLNLQRRVKTQTLITLPQRLHFRLVKTQYSNHTTIILNPISIL